MSKTTEDPTKYYRTGIAIPIDRKTILNERLAALGMNTIGDLVTMFVLADGMVEAIAALRPKYEETLSARKAMKVSKKSSLNELSKLSPEDLANLLALAKINQKIEA